MILVFGSLNMDLTMRVTALPRPGETVLCPSYRTLPGGKGNNQAVAAARAGAAVAMIGRVGDDGFGQRLRANLMDNGVDATGVATAVNPTGIAAIAVDDRAENCITVASGANLELRAADVPDAMLRPGTTVVTQMEVPVAETLALLRRARAAGARTLLNLAPAPVLDAGAAADLAAAVAASVDVLVVNELEGAALAGGAGGDGLDLCRRLASDLGTACVMTLGGQGAVAAQDGRLWRVRALPVEVADTTGAGDTFTGVLAAALDSGLSLPDGLARAGAAAGLACCGVGAQDSMPDAVRIAAAVAGMPPVEAVG